MKADIDITKVVRTIIHRFLYSLYTNSKAPFPLLTLALLVPYYMQFRHNVILL